MSFDIFNLIICATYLFCNWQSYLKPFRRDGAIQSEDANGDSVSDLMTMVFAEQNKTEKTTNTYQMFWKTFSLDTIEVFIA